MIKINMRPYLSATTGIAAFFALSLASAQIVHAATTTLALYSTGQSSVYSAGTQTQFSSGVADTPWTIISNPSGTAAATALVTTPHSGWVADTTTSEWISNVADSTGNTSAAGNYDYQTSFIIPTNVTLSSVQILFNVAEDDSVTSVFLNGTSTGITYSAYTAFSGTETINASNATFKAGTNTIDFVVNNQGSTANPSGLNVVFTSATGTVAAPEPGSVGLLLFGATGLIMQYGRRRFISCR